MRIVFSPGALAANAAFMRMLAIALLLACPLVAATATPAHAAEKAIWGPLTLPGGKSAFPIYRDLGVDTLQLPLNWDATAATRPRDPRNPADPSYRWPASVDRAVAEGAANGIQVALLVSRSPSWANGGRSALHSPNAADFASFMAATSRRYPAIRRWMIWGEPNRDDRFLPNAEGSPVGPRAYAQILDAAYGALKSVSQANIVIGGMTWTGGTVKPAPFLDFMRLPNGNPPRLDWFGHNPFPFRFPNLRELNIAGGWRDISDMDTFSEQLRRAYGPRARFWLSEFNVLSDRPSREFDTSVPRQGQAQYVTAAYGIADSLPSVAGLGWLSLLDEPEGPGSSNFGLLTANGTPKPAYAAYGQAPSVRFRPGVSANRRVGRRQLSRRGLRVVVRARVTGRVRVDLTTKRGRRVIRMVRSLQAEKRRTLRLRRRGLARGRYVLVVRASRAETVRRDVRVR